MSVGDFMATICTILGIDHLKEYDTPGGRPMPLVAKGASLSDDAKSTFRRRYRLSLQRVMSQPDTAKMNHRKVLGPAMKCHGQLAAAIAQFHHTGTGKMVIDRDAFLKAAHVIENECKSFAIRASARKHGPAVAKAVLEAETIDATISRFIWCY